MGFFKSQRELVKLGKEIGENTDFIAMRRNGLERMQQSTQMMAAQTQAANIAATGVAATATVVQARSTGSQINLEQVIELDLTIMPDGLPPYPVTVTQAISTIYLARVQPGSALAVKVDPDAPASVWIDFTRTP